VQKEIFDYAEKEGQKVEKTGKVVEAEKYSVWQEG
jgi:hypothetical protein